MKNTSEKAEKRNELKGQCAQLVFDFRQQGGISKQFIPLQIDDH